MTPNESSPDNHPQESPTISTTSGTSSVSHDGEKSSVNAFTSTSDGWRILDDLDVRASDILQANVVIWVEGPSDRIYVDRWIELWTDGRLQPGVHYQCIPYGGSCETHVSFDNPDDVNDLICALRVSRHAIFLADSDRATKESPLKPAVERLLVEVADSGGFGFVTSGRTVENYIPRGAWRCVANDTVLGVKQFKDAIEYARDHLKPKPRSKVDLSKRIVPHLSKEMLESHLDLRERLDEICKKIRGWNGLDEQYNPI